MAAPAAPSLLPGQSPPLMVISSTDKGGVIIIATALGLAFVLVSLLIRAYVRYGFSPGRFAWDDGFILTAAVSSFGLSPMRPKTDLRPDLFDFPECRCLRGSEQRIRQDHRRCLFSPIGGDPEGALYLDPMLRKPCRLTK
jgi:hypothetical protein